MSDVCCPRMPASTTLILDQTSPPLAAAFAAACGDAAATTAPCGYAAFATACLAAAAAPLEEAGVLAGAAQAMRSVVAARRAYVAAHEDEFGPGAPSADGRRGAPAFVANALAAQWDLVGLVAGAGGRVALLRPVRRTRAAASALPAYRALSDFFFFDAYGGAPGQDGAALECERAWFAEEAAWAAAGAEFFVQEGGACMGVQEWLARARAAGAAPPPIIIDECRHFLVALVAADGSVRALDTLPASPSPWLEALVEALAAARAALDCAATAVEASKVRP
jgi:hypothetical protein